MIIWLQFIAAGVIVIMAGRNLVRHADTIADEKGWGGLWIGFVLLALATTLPELFTSVGSVVLAKAPDLALGNILGSIAFNLFIIAILDFIQGTGPILRKTDQGLIVCGSMSIVLSAIVVLGISSEVSLTIGGISPFSIIIVFVWFAGARLVFSFQERNAAGKPKATGGNLARKAFLKYLLCALFIFGASIWLVYTAKEIARVTGWEQAFVGTLLLGIATSLPEITTTVSAVRRGAFDMAIGNILGANMLNVAIVFVCDAFLPGAGILSVVSTNHILTALLGISMTAIVIVGIIYKSKKSFMKLGWDAVGIAVVYLAGSYLLFKM
jgi:cation:H+ antiporter